MQVFECQLYSTHELCLTVNHPDGVGLDQRLQQFCALSIGATLKMHTGNTEHTIHSQGVGSPCLSDTKGKQ